jgi:nucleoside-diphosphate-sugar epimerase
MEHPTVLITGATGFIGGCTLARLLETRPDSRAMVLVRERGFQPASERLRRSLGRFLAAEQLDKALLRCEVVSGDLTDPATCQSSRLDEATHVIHLASLKKLAAQRLDDVTHVLHLASNTNLRAVRSVRQTNVLGTMALAHRMRRVAGLQRFLYVGTAYICGEKSEPIVREEMFPQVRARHFTEYTASKAECEWLLRNTAPELPLVIARPSVVVGHTRLGCLPSSSIFWFFRACDALRLLTCPLDSRDDVVPVDWVADALLLLLFKPELRHDCYHLSAGSTSSVCWQDIAMALAECYGRRPETPYQIVSTSRLASLRDRLTSLGPGDGNHLLAALQIFFRFMEIDAEIFDNSRLLNEGMPAPPKFTDYLRRCATQPHDRTVYQQMLDDFEAASSPRDRNRDIAEPSVAAEPQAAGELKSASFAAAD